jgi:hypothetical protein
VEELVSEREDGDSEATGEIAVVVNSFDVATVASTVNSLVGTCEAEFELEIIAEVAGMLSLVDVLSLVGAVVSEVLGKGTPEDSEAVSRGVSTTVVITSTPDSKLVEVPSFVGEVVEASETVMVSRTNSIGEVSTE